MKNSSLSLSLVATLRAIAWLSGLALLLLALVCTAIAEYGPPVGRWLGRWSARAIAAGRRCRPWCDRHLRPLLVAADYAVRRHFAAQFGTAYPSLTRAIAPAVLLSVTVAPFVTAAAPSSPGNGPEPVAPAIATPAPPPGPAADQLQTLTIRALKAIARERGLPRYGSLTKRQLAIALA